MIVATIQTLPAPHFKNLFLLPMRTIIKHLRLLATGFSPVVKSRERSLFGFFYCGITLHSMSFVVPRLINIHNVMIVMAVFFQGGSRRLNYWVVGCTSNGFSFSFRHNNNNIIQPGDESDTMNVDHWINTEMCLIYDRLFLIITNFLF